MNAMDLEGIVSELHVELEQIDQAIRCLKRLALSPSKRRSRPAKCLVETKAKESPDTKAREHRIGAGGRRHTECVSDNGVPTSRFGTHKKIATRAANDVMHNSHGWPGSSYRARPGPSAASTAGVAFRVRKPVRPPPSGQFSGNHESWLRC